MSEVSSPSPSRPGSPVGPLPELNTTRPYRFNWDPSSRRPGPESVSGTTEGRGDYFAAQPRIDIFNGSSTNLAALPSEWSSSRHGFHAISTVLNNPHKRQAPPKAHSALPAVVPAELPRVRRKDFDSYLRAIAPEWDRFNKNTELGREGAAQLDGPSTPRASLSSMDALPRTPRIAPGKAMPPLESVPSVFFQSNFNLGDPRTFNAVTEQGDEGDADAPDPSSLSHSLPLLEKFSHYADTVEQHLVREISLRSTSFFAALTNLNELQSESEQCLEGISKLRGLLHDVDEKGAKRGLEIVRKESKMRNLATVKESVKAVQGFVEMTGVAKNLVVAGQLSEALGVIEVMETQWSAPNAVPMPPKSAQSLAPAPRTRNGRNSPLSSMPEDSVPEHGDRKPPPVVSLSSLQAFASLPVHLRTLTLEVAASLSSELVNILRSDFSECLERIPNEQQGLKEAAGLSLKLRLRPLLHDLVRTKGVREAMLSWREVVLSEIRGVIKRLSPFDTGDGPRETLGIGTGDSPTERLSTMAHPDFMNLIRNVYRSFLNGVEGLQTQNSIILDVLGEIQLQVPADVASLKDELSEILSSVAELSNTEAATVISRRSEQHAALDLPDFMTLFNESWNFVVKCEVICQRMIVGLRGAIVSQAKVFLQTFHQTRISRSAKLVEDEQWNAAEVPPFLQSSANILVDSAVRDASELIITSGGESSSLSVPGATPNGGIPPPSILHSPSAPAKPQTTGTSSHSKHLRIEDRTYFTVSATSEVLILILDYLRVIVNLPMLTTDTMSRVIEFLKAFNSRTCQVVLGAGAMRSAGLKNITAKHLALASQSLSIMIALIPYVRETFRRHLSPKQAVMLVEFDKLKRDYQEHQNEIHTKLIAIMGDRLTAHIKTLQSINWEVPKPGGGVNDYMELLVKETVTLHKVLSRYLATPVVEYVMTQVFAAINHRLSEEYGKIELPHQEAKTRLLADAKFLNQKLAALKNVGTPSAMLETVIAEKPIPRKISNAPLNGVASSANQRLKGLLYTKSPALDKALPIPVPTPTPPPPTPPPISSPNARTPPPAANVAHASANGHNDVSGKLGASDPALLSSLPHSPTPQRPTPLRAESSFSAGFKQIEPSGLTPGLEQAEASGPGDQTTAAAPHDPPPVGRTSPAPPEHDSPKTMPITAGLATSPRASLASRADASTHDAHDASDDGSTRIGTGSLSRTASPSPHTPG